MFFEKNVKKFTPQVVGTKCIHPKNDFFKKNEKKLPPSPLIPALTVNSCDATYECVALFKYPRAVSYRGEADSGSCFPRFSCGSYLWFELGEPKFEIVHDSSPGLSRHSFSSHVRLKNVVTQMSVRLFAFQRTARTFRATGLRDSLRQEQQTLAEVLAEFEERQLAVFLVPKL